MTSTVLPILCLMDWQSPKCRLNAALPPPKFASNYDIQQPKRPTPTEAEAEHERSFVLPLPQLSRNDIESISDEGDDDDDITQDKHDGLN